MIIEENSFMLDNGQMAWSYLVEDYDEKEGKGFYSTIQVITYPLPSSTKQKIEL